MKRDMELVRKILLALEERDDDSKEFNMEDVDNKTLRYHLKIMEQAGLVDVDIKPAGDNMFWIYASITWFGHEYLSSIKNDNIWSKTKEELKRRGMDLGEVGIDVVYEYAKYHIKKLLGLD